MKHLTVLLMIVMRLGGTVYAEDLQVQIIGGEDVPQATLDLDDMQLGQTYEIDGYARIMPVSFEYKDIFPQYSAGNAGNNEYRNRRDHENVTGKVCYSNSYYVPYYYEIYWQNSGTNADFAWLLMDVTNMQKEPTSFMQETSVKVVFDEEYEYAGWVRQFNYDYDSTREIEGEEGVETYGSFIRAALDPADEQPIDMVYTGHYVFGCTLPTAVVNGSEPLSMVIDLGGNELTYNIR